MHYVYSFIGFTNFSVVLFAFLFREDLHHKTLTKLLTIVVNCVLLLLLLSGCCCLKLALRQGQGLLYFITALLCCALARHIWLLFKCFCCCHRVKDLPTLFFSSLYSSFISPLPSLLLSSNSSPTLVIVLSVLMPQWELSSLSLLACLVFHSIALSKSPMKA